MTALSSPRWSTIQEASARTRWPVADVNGDGKRDLVVSSCGSEFDCFGTGLVGILLGNGDGTFQPVTTYSTSAGYADSVAVADLNGDSNLDLVVANCTINCSGYGSVSVLLGNGDGTFDQPLSIQYSDWESVLGRWQ